MGLRRKVYHPVNLILCKNGCDRLLVTDIRLHERIIIPPFEFFQVLQIARIGQGIHIDDPDPRRICGTYNEYNWIR